MSGSARSGALGLALVALGPVLLAACRPGEAVELIVQDEDGLPLDRVFADIDGARVEGTGGRLRLDLSRPVLALVGAEGYLAEPVPVGLDAVDEAVVVRLWASLDGRRFALHAGGDAMLARRFLDPEQGEPLVVTGDGGQSARAVVRHLAPLMRAADLRMVNLETAVGGLPAEDAWPGKRYVLQSPPEVVHALDALGVDLVGLANNHVRDWLDEGVAETLATLDAAGIGRVGAGLDGDEAAATAIWTVGEAKVAVLAFSTLGGEAVNDELPTDNSRAPEDLSSSASPWKWEKRAWGWAPLGIEEKERRAGSAWRLYLEAEARVDAEEAAAIWSSLSGVYPELQDLLARRGHGGAGGYWGEQSLARIREARAQADVVVVQLHSGVEYAPVPTSAMAAAARGAVEAGASLVIGHHPHVIQGVEWYQGVPILWSLGNVLFDQDRFITFPSMVLRAVWEDDGRLLDLRLVPIYLDGYLPVPITGHAARSVLATVAERSRLEALATRLDLNREQVVFAQARPDGAEPADVRLEWGTGRVLPPALEVERERILLPARGWADLPERGLVRRTATQDPPEGLLVGRGLVGVGVFENVDVDEDEDDLLGWRSETGDAVLSRRGASQGRGSLQLVRGPDNLEPVLVRTGGQVSLPAHRLYADALGQEPLDGPASYSLRLAAFADGETSGLKVRVDLYHVADEDPTEEPSNVLLRQVELSVGLLDGRWRETLVDIPDSALEPLQGRTPNAAIVNVLLYPPERRTTVVRVDRLELIEWREARQQPDGFGVVEMLRAPMAPRVLELDRLRW